MSAQSKRRHNPPDPRRVTVAVQLSRPIARIVSILAHDAGVSLSRIVTEMVHESLGIPVMPLRPHRKPNGRTRARRSTGGK